MHPPVSRFLLLALASSTCSYVAAAPSASKRIRAARRDAPPKLTDALAAAAKVKCTDPTFKESQDNDPGTQWKSAGAEDLLEAAIQSYRQDARGKYNSLTAYLAELFGTDDSTFDCSDDRSNNECTGWGPANHDCDQEVGPAGKMILDSVSWINNFYAPIDNDLTKAGLAGLAGVPDLAENDIKYDKPSMSAEQILGFIAELLVPVGAGQMFGKTLSTTVNDLAKDAMKIGKPPSYQASQLSQFYLNKMNDYKLMANQMAFEMTDVATQILAAGKNPIEGAASIINEIAGFDELVEHVVTDWSNGAQKSVENLFSGITQGDTVVDGISDYATLKTMLKDGAWSRAMKVGDIGSDAATAMFSHLLPLALHQNDKVRPTLIVRPYKCDDKGRADADTTFQEMIHGQKIDLADISVSLDEAPGLCFFFLDANKDGAGLCTQRTGCADKPRPLQALLGLRHSALTGGSKFGGMKLEDYAHSLYKGWLANGKKNGVPTYKVDPKAAGGSDANLFDFPVNSAGLYSSYFNVCGNDDPNAKLEKNKTPDDVKLIFDNTVSAADWSWADASKGFPCRADPPRHP